MIPWPAHLFFFLWIPAYIPQSIYIQTSLHLRISRSKHSVFGTIHRYLFQFFSLFSHTPSCCIVLTSSLSNCTNLNLCYSFCISFIFTIAFLIHLKSWFIPYDASRGDYYCSHNSKRYSQIEESRESRYASITGNEVSGPQVYSRHPPRVI